MKKILTLSLFAVAIIFFLNGCVPPETMWGNETKKFPVEIISEPSGAKIEINSNYIGETPLTVDLEGWASTRTFTRRHEIVAHSPTPYGSRDFKTFSGFYEPDISNGDKIPETIYFNLK